MWCAMADGETRVRGVKQDVPARRDGHVTRAFDGQQNEEEKQERSEHFILVRAAAECVRTLFARSSGRSSA